MTLHRTGARPNSISTNGRHESCAQHPIWRSAAQPATSLLSPARSVCSCLLQQHFRFELRSAHSQRNANGHSRNALSASLLSNQHSHASGTMRHGPPSSCPQPLNVGPPSCSCHSGHRRCWQMLNKDPPYAWAAAASCCSELLQRSSTSWRTRSAAWAQRGPF